ncbi:hypothetical protein KC316_g14728 [Hortaea werneckii]|nr:hypothetical protein KC324_g14618 [Hortaea werneckii]KAI7546892.1 hypothetical protein KC316_g14728 [Hortaea werneckii]
MHLNSFISVASILMPSALAINWSVMWYPDHAACMGDSDGVGTAGDENDVLWCLAASYTHDVKTDNIEAAGKHVHLYTDAACTNEIANIASNGCHVTPEDAPIAAYTVRDA